MGEGGSELQNAAFKYYLNWNEGRDSAEWTADQLNNRGTVFD